MRSKPIQTVIDFCLEHAEQAPVSRRIELYHCLAEFCGNEQLTAELHKLADDLESAEFRCREFAFQFSLNRDE